MNLDEDWNAMKRAADVAISTLFIQLCRRFVKKFVRRHRNNSFQVSIVLDYLVQVESDELPTGDGVAGKLSLEL